MPRKYAKRKPRRRTYRRRPARKRYAPRLSSPYVPSGMPKQRIAKLRYVDGISRSSASGILNEYKFRANGLFDPDVTGTGHQPMGFDQWATLFNHYTVLGSKITIVVNQKTVTPVTGMMGIYLADGTASNYITYSEFAEAKKGTWKMLSNSTDLKPSRVTSKFSTKKYFGVKDVVDNQNLRALVSTNPAEEAYYHVWLQAHDYSSSLTVEWTVVIDYIVKFHEPKDIPQSN